MDKKYNNIKTPNQLDLSRGSRTSLSSGSSGSGKTDFSTKSKEDRYNEAYKNDFKSSPKNEAGPKMKSASPPKKKKEETDSKNKIKNPLSGRLVSMEYYNKLVKSGKIKEAGTGVAKRESPVAKKESPKSFDNFYEEIVKEIGDWKSNKGNYQNRQIKPKNTHNMFANKLLEAIKDAYKKNPSWDYMKQALIKISDEWDKFKYIEYHAYLPRIDLRPIIIKYGYDDKDIKSVNGDIDFYKSYF